MPIEVEEEMEMVRGVKYHQAIIKMAAAHSKLVAAIRKVFIEMLMIINILVI